jgi:hypothetical protein
MTGFARQMNLHNVYELGRLNHVKRAPQGLCGLACSTLEQGLGRVWTRLGSLVLAGFLRSLRARAFGPCGLEPSVPAGSSLRSLRARAFGAASLGIFLASGRWGW